MATDIDNPYASPPAAPAGRPANDEAAQLDWKSVLRRWEVLRLPYNLIVGVTGLISLSMFLSLVPSELILAGIVFYGVGANVCYFCGPIAELYIHWIADTWGGATLFGSDF
jgi:predicted membrane channel-forming protein YqfA (hemolysin III family)